MTRYRDLWAGGKQSTPELVSAIARAKQSSLEELGKEIGVLVEAGNQISRAASFQDFYAAVEKLAEISRHISHLSHGLRAFCDFQVPPATLFTDHFINQFFLMSAFKRTWWVEGPTFCGLGIDPGARILELGCGMGYYTDIFFSPFASEIIAVDIDPRAIEFARRFHQAKNIRYEVVDFSQELPQGPFDVVIWSPTIFAYGVDDVDSLMKKLRNVMTNNARLLGWTAIEAERSDDNVLWHDLASLGARLKKYFANVRVFERTHPTVQPPRTNMYFSASDGSLPFDQDWTRSLRL